MGAGFRTFFGTDPGDTAQLGVDLSTTGGHQPDWGRKSGAGTVPLRGSRWDDPRGPDRRNPPEIPEGGSLTAEFDLQADRLLTAAGTKIGVVAGA